MKTIAIIGAGAAGMIASVFAAQNGAKVRLIEKNNTPGKKILITGGGRCNLTNTDDAQATMAKILRNPRFMHSALRTFDSSATCDFFHSIGVDTKVEAGGRVFPVSDDAGDVVAALRANLRRLDVDIEYNCRVDKIVPRGTIFEIYCGGRIIKTDAVIIATGGLSAPQTGSDGDGLRFAKELGHGVTKLYPALVPLVVEGNFDFGGLMGLTVNAGIAAKAVGKMIFDGRGDIMFTHFGISGPVAFTASAHLAAKMHLAPEIVLDFAPDMDKKVLDALVLDIFNQNLKKSVKNALYASAFLPERLVLATLLAADVKADVKVCDISRAMRERFCRVVKDFRLKVAGSLGFGAAVITCGGVDVKQINPATMESKVLPGLYFAGEILDVDGLTGGYNLQIAFATGHLAGISAASALNERDVYD